MIKFKFSGILFILSIFLISCSSSSSQKAENIYGRYTFFETHQELSEGLSMHMKSILTLSVGVATLDVTCEYGGFIENARKYTLTRQLTFPVAYDLSKRSFKFLEGNRFNVTDKVKINTFPKATQQKLAKYFRKTFPNFKEKDINRALKDDTYTFSCEAGAEKDEAYTFDFNSSGDVLLTPIPKTLLLKRIKP